MRILPSDSSALTDSPMPIDSFPMVVGETKHSSIPEIPWPLRRSARLSALWIARAWWPEARIPRTILPGEPEARRRRRWARSLATLFDLASRERVAACRRLRIEGWEHLHIERSEEPGRIVTGSRLLGFDLGVLALGWFHRPLLLPPPGSGAADQLLARLQTEAGHQTEEGEAWASSAREHLARSGWLALAADGTEGGKTDAGDDALRETIHLARESRASIVPLFVYGLGDGQHRLTVTEPIPHDKATPEQLAARISGLAAAPFS